MKTKKEDIKFFDDKVGTVLSNVKCKDCSMSLRHYELMDYKNGKCEYCQEDNNKEK